MQAGKGDVQPIYKKGRGTAAVIQLAQPEQMEKIDKKGRVFVFNRACCARAA